VSLPAPKEKTTKVLHNGPAIVALADWTRPTYPLRSLSGDLVAGKFCTSTLRDLAERGLVSAIGSRRTIRFFQFNMDEDETSRALRMGVVEATTRARTPLDFLAVMLAARSTTRKVAMPVYFADGAVRRRVVYEHKAARA